jgi:hypothetical protein
VTDVKQVNLVEANGKWKIEFKGPVNRRDLRRIHRSIDVEYAKMTRRRSLDRIKAQRLKRMAENQEEALQKPQPQKDLKNARVYRP